MRPRYIWVLTTGDNLELPRAVADSAGELSRITGIREDNIRRAAKRNTKYKTKYRVFKVPEERQEKNEICCGDQKTR